MKVVFIAGPYRAANAWEREQNIRLAEIAALRVASAGHAPLCPHTNTRFFDGTLTDEFWLAATQELLRRCDIVLMVGEWKMSEGATAEYHLAHELGIRVVESIGAIDA